MEQLNDIYNSLMVNLQSAVQYIENTVREVTKDTTTNELYIASGIVAATLLGIYFIPGFLRRRASARLRHQKREQCKESIGKLRQRLEMKGELSQEKREDIVKLPVQELVEKLQTGTLSAVHVLEAYQAKALQVLFTEIKLGKHALQFLLIFAHNRFKLKAASSLKPPDTRGEGGGSELS